MINYLLINEDNYLEIGIKFLEVNKHDYQSQETKLVI